MLTKLHLKILSLRRLCVPGGQFLWDSSHKIQRIEQNTYIVREVKYEQMGNGTTTG